VFWLTLKQGRMLALTGAVIGVATAYMSGRLVSSWLYEVRASDPAILGGAALLVVLIALLATLAPAYRASRIDSARVLRPD
jgi:ABC-type antimicrobial peptide transport system permease subunit